jgi:hypothetical protein
VLKINCLPKIDFSLEVQWEKRGRGDEVHARRVEIGGNDVRNDVCAGDEVWRKFCGDPPSAIAPSAAARERKANSDPAAAPILLSVKSEKKTFLALSKKAKMTPQMSPRFFEWNQHV